MDSNVNWSSPRRIVKPDARVAPSSIVLQNVSGTTVIQGTVKASRLGPKFALQAEDGSQLFEMAPEVTKIENKIVNGPSFALKETGDHLESREGLDFWEMVRLISEEKVVALSIPESGVPSEMEVENSMAERNLIGVPAQNTVVEAWMKWNDVLQRDGNGPKPNDQLYSAVSGDGLVSSATNIPANTTTGEEWNAKASPFEPNSLREESVLGDDTDSIISTHSSSDSLTRADSANYSQSSYIPCTPGSSAAVWNSSRDIYSTASSRSTSGSYASFASSVQSYAYAMSTGSINIDVESLKSVDFEGRGVLKEMEELDIQVQSGREESVCDEHGNEAEYKLNSPSPVGDYKRMNRESGPCDIPGFRQTLFGLHRGGIPAIIVTPPVEMEAEETAIVHDMPSSQNYRVIPSSGAATAQPALQNTTESLIHSPAMFKREDVDDLSSLERRMESQ